MYMHEFDLYAACVAVEPGLELVEPRPGSDDVCSESELIFRCTTTGRGDTELRFGDTQVPISEFRFRHSRYRTETPNQDENETRLDGKVMAGDLLRSASEGCFDMLRNTTDFCYTTSLVIRITDRIRCGTIVCSNIFNNGTDEVTTLFGSAVIARSKFTC